MVVRGILFALIILAMCAMVVAASEVNLRDFGAKIDGETDDSGVIQKALDAIKEQGGGRVFLPAGKYRMDNPITVPTGVTLAGTWEAPHSGALRTGTTFMVYAGKGDEEGPALVTLQSNSAVSGISFYYPEQRIPDPYPYPWTIQGRGHMHGSVMDVTLVNSWKGIDFGSRHHELHYIRNVYGCPLKMGVRVDQCTDVGRIENVHFNPHYWARAQAPNIPNWRELRQYVFENLVGFEFGRSDWQYVFNTFVFGPKIGYRFYKGEGERFSGTTNGNFLGIAADWAETSILIEESGSPGLLITNGQFVGGVGADSMIHVKDSHTGVAQFLNCSFWGPTRRIAIVEGKGGLSLNQCNFVDWAGEYYAIEAHSGELMVQNCWFRRAQKQISLAPDVAAAVISGNIISGEIMIDNRSNGDVQMHANAVKK